MRDKIKDFDYFSKFILEEETRYDKFHTKIVNDEVRNDRISAVKLKMDSIKFQLFQAKYSLGLDLDVLRKDYIELVHNMEEFWHTTSGYMDMLWMISIGIMYELDKKELLVLKNLVRKNGLKDWVIEYLLSFGDMTSEQKDLDVIMTRPYQYLKEAIMSKENILKKIKIYLFDKWYEGHKEMGWYGIDKHKEKLYSGYWSYESGAIIKILGIDDMSLKETQYYPYDLVHYTK